MHKLTVNRKFSIPALFLSCLFIINPAYSATKINTTDSTNNLVQPTFKNPNAAFVLYTGTLSDSGNATIPKGCPAGFRAYPTFEGGSREFPNQVIATQSKFCLHSFTATSSSISLSITTTANYSTMKILDNYGLYYARIKGLYGTGSAAQAYPSTQISPDTANAANAITNIFFTIYCYPSATAPSIKLC